MSLDNMLQCLKQLGVVYLFHDSEVGALVVVVRSLACVEQTQKTIAGWGRGQKELPLHPPGAREDWSCWYFWTSDRHDVPT